MGDGPASTYRRRFVGLETGRMGHKIPPAVKAKPPALNYFPLAVNRKPPEVIYARTNPASHTHTRFPSHSPTQIPAAGNPNPWPPHPMAPRRSPAQLTSADPHLLPRAAPSQIPVNALSWPAWPASAGCGLGLPAPVSQHRVVVLGPGWMASPAASRVRSRGGPIDPFWPRGRRIWPHLSLFLTPLTLSRFLSLSFTLPAAAATRVEVKPGRGTRGWAAICGSSPTSMRADRGVPGLNAVAAWSPAPPQSSQRYFLLTPHRWIRSPLGFFSPQFAAVRFAVGGAAADDEDCEERTNHFRKSHSGRCISLKVSCSLFPPSHSPRSVPKKRRHFEMH